MSLNQVENLLSELEVLVVSLGYEVQDRCIVPLREPKSPFLIGRGKAEAVMQKAKALRCDSIVFDEELTPSQQRNWEATLKGTAVMDRQEVILMIFSQRAQTREAILQIKRRENLGYILDERGSFGYSEMHPTPLG